MKQEKKALLVISFGTSYHATREKNIERIENELKTTFPDRKFYHAYTSGMILKKLRERDGIIIPSVPEVMEQILSDGITDLLVQPTHIINGIENDIMKKTVMSFQNQIEKIYIGTPLLTSTQDQFRVIGALKESLPPLSSRDAVVFMGHGTDHHANSVYAALDYTFKNTNCPHVYMGTVEAYPGINEILSQLEAKNIRHVYLMPFMLVAGDHATNDLAGGEPDSWKSILEEKGYAVTCILKGLGEYEQIRSVYVEHAKEALC